MFKKGQNLTEFMLILAIVVIGGVLILTIFGKNINTLFTSSNEKSKQYKPFGWDNSSTPNLKITETKVINGQEVNIYEDGSVGFKVENQDVYLSENILSNLNEVFETSGSEGVNDRIMEALKTVIANNKDTFAPEEVPVEMLFGKGERKSLTPNYDIKAEGNANAVNIVGLKVGDQVVIIQKDQACAGEQCSFSQGIYQVTTTVDSNNKIVPSEAIFELDNNIKRTGKLTEGSINYDKANNQIKFSSIFHEDEHNFDSSWDIVFDTRQTEKI
ncbi:MAG: hypothetical protein AB1782_03255 [Cyanobacteriota bacterium]